MRAVVQQPLGGPDLPADPAAHRVVALGAARAPSSRTRDQRRAPRSDDQADDRRRAAASEQRRADRLAERGRVPRDAGPTTSSAGTRRRRAGSSARSGGGQRRRRRTQPRAARRPRGRASGAGPAADGTAGDPAQRSPGGHRPQHGRARPRPRRRWPIARAGQQRAAGADAGARRRSGPGRRAGRRRRASARRGRPRARSRSPSPSVSSPVTGGSECRSTSRPTLRAERPGVVGDPRRAGQVRRHRPASASRSASHSRRWTPPPRG